MLDALTLIVALTLIAVLLWVGLIRGFVLDHRVARVRRKRLKRPKPTLLH